MLPTGTGVEYKSFFETLDPERTLLPDSIIGCGLKIYNTRSGPIRYRDFNEGL